MDGKVYKGGLRNGLEEMADSRGRYFLSGKNRRIEDEGNTMAYQEEIAHKKVTLPNGLSYEQPVGLFINNKFVAPKAGKFSKVENPATLETVVEVAAAGVEDVEYAVECADRAFHGEAGSEYRDAAREAWSTWDPRARGKLLARLADLMEQNFELMASIETTDNGKTIALARGDVQVAIDCIRDAGAYADKISGRTINTGDGYINYTTHEPIGVCGQIIPWNFPLMMLAWKVGPALAMGNTIVLKPASATPLNGLFFAELTRQAGFPDGVVNIVTGPGGSIGSAITEHPRIRKVAFTGSTEIGKDIAVSASGSNVKKITLELGGKSAHLVFDDADIKKTLPNLVNGIFKNAGQICSSGSRIYVQEGIYDKLIKEFKNYIEQEIHVGDPFDEKNFQGAITNRSQYDTIMKYIDAGRKEGAEVLTGGVACGDKGYFVRPTVFVNVTEDMTIVQEEIFGPVVTISKFSTFEDGIRKANASEYGLGAGVETTNLSTGLKAAKLLHAGTVWVNTYNDFDSRVPFGGVKQSGYGREMGEEVFHCYSEVKAVRIKL